MEIEAAFGDVLREHRKRSGLSQEVLALECGLDRTYISLLERGLRQPSLRTLFQISKNLNISPSQLVMEVENKVANG